MMNEALKEEIRAALQRVKPHKVRAYHTVDGALQLARDVPIPGNRKRWAAVIEVLDKIEWTRVELVDRSGGVLDVIEAQPDDDAGEIELNEPPDVDLPSSAAAGVNFERLLALMLKAQQIALRNREAEVQIALQASTSAVRMLTEAVGALAQVQRMTLDAQADAFRARESAAAEPDKEGESASEKLLAQMMPMILAKLGPALLAPAGPKPAVPANGVK